MPLLLLFILVPIIEIWVLIEVGSAIGALPTIFLILATAFIGLALLRQQGFSTLFRMQQRMNSGELPASEILEGVVLAVGGALLLTPGFVTDAIGFMCLIPVTRKMMIAKAMAGGLKMQGFSAQYHSSSQHSHTSQGQSHRPTVIDGEFEREKD